MTMPQAAIRKSRPGPLCWLAIGFCEQPEFLAFCCARTAAEAAQFIKRTCEIESRKELDTDAQARQRFHDRIRRPYVRAQGI